MFSKRSQLKDERFEEYYIVLCNLAQICEFGYRHDELISDRIMCGINSGAGYSVTMPSHWIRQSMTVARMNARESGQKTSNLDQQPQM